MLIDPNNDVVFKRTLRTMEAFGGGFVQALANCGYPADMHNRVRLVHAFADIFENYGPGSYFYDEVARREEEQDQNQSRVWSFCVVHEGGRRDWVWETDAEGYLIVHYGEGETPYDTVNGRGSMRCAPALPNSSNSETFTLVGRRWMDRGVWTPEGAK